MRMYDLWNEFPLIFFSFSLSLSLFRTATPLGLIGDTQDEEEKKSFSHMFVMMMMITEQWFDQEFLLMEIRAMIEFLPGRILLRKHVRFNRKRNSLLDFVDRLDLVITSIFEREKTSCRCRHRRRYTLIHVSSVVYNYRYMRISFDLIF